MFHVKRLLAGLLCWTVTTAAQAHERVQVPGDGLDLAGLVYRPEGAGPFPGALILHGCTGMWTRSDEPTASYRVWAEHLRREGFVALLLDSFGPRGEKEICTQQKRRVRPDGERKADAMAALRWLARQPAVDAERNVLLGLSNGGATVLYTALQAAPSEARHFRAAVAFYPGCGALARAGAYRPAFPS